MVLLAALHCILLPAGMDEAVGLGLGRIRYSRCCWHSRSSKKEF